MKKIILILFIFILSCSRESNNSEKGSLTLMLSAKNNNFIYFEFTIENIYLIDKNNRYTNINDGVEYKVNFSKLEHESEIILNVNVPENTYYDVAIDINLNKSVVKDAGEGVVETPNLYDIYALKVNENESIYRIESNIDGGFPLIIQKDRPANLSIELDVDASTRWLSRDENDVSDLLISPVFTVSSLIGYPENVHLAGTIKSFEDDRLLVTPIKFHAIKQVPIEIPLSESTLYTFNNEARTLEEWKNDLAISKDGIIIFSGKEKDDKLDTMALAYFTDSILYRNQGIVTQDMTLVGSRETLSKQISSIEFLEQQVDNIAVGTAVKSSYTTNKEQIDMDGAIALTGTIINTLNTGAELNPLSIDNLSSSLFFSEDEIISVRFTDDFLTNDDLINFSGSFTGNGDFRATNFEFVDTEKQRLHLALSLSSTDDLVTSVTNEGLLLNTDKIDDMLSYVKLSDLPVREDTEHKITKIIIVNLPEKLVILTDRIQPSHDIYQLLTVNDFISEVNDQKSQGYVINSIVADGRIDGDSFIATSLMVTLLPPINQETTSTLLKGYASHALLFGNAYTNPKEYASKFKGYIKGNLEKYDNPFSRSNAAKRKPVKKKITLADISVSDDGGYVKFVGNDSQSSANPLAKFATDTQKSAEFLRNLQTRNPDLGAYFSDRINSTNKKEKYLIKFYKQTQEIKALTPLYEGTDRVSEIKHSILLDQYLTDVKDNKKSAVNASVFNPYFENGKNKFLLNILLEETPSEFRRKKHEINLNDIILTNDDTGTLRKLLLNDTAAYRKIFDTYEKYVVAHFDSESLTKRYLHNASKADKGDFLSSFERKFKNGGDLALSEDFKKINKLITDHIETTTTRNEQNRKVPLNLQDAFKSATTGSNAKKFASFLTIDTDTSAESIKKLRHSLIGTKPKTTIKLQYKVAGNSPTPINIDVNKRPKVPPKPTVRRRN